MRTLLTIGYVWPEPHSSAAGYRMLALLNTMAEAGWNIVFASPAEKTPHKIDLTRLGINEQEIALNCSSFDAYIEQLQPDAVMFDRFMMEEQFGWRVAKSCPSALRILDTEDLFCLRHARQEAFQRDGIINPVLTPEVLFTDMARREIAAILRSDISLIISEAEMEILTSQFAIDPALLHYAPFVQNLLHPENLSSQSLSANLPNFEQRQHFAVIGNFRHAPNWDAVLYLKQVIWPLIRRQLPKTELHIYGAYPPKKATQLHNVRDGFLVKGWAEDAHDVLRRARINLAPLRFGAGLKGKLLDAMETGTPSITTSIGAEGMAGEMPWCGAIADDPDVFAAAAVELYNQPQQWLQAQYAGFDIVRERFNAAQHKQNLHAKIATTQANLAQHRLRNFTGSMLLHHQHRSTEFMSRWIETKNRLRSQS